MKLKRIGATSLVAAIAFTTLSIAPAQAITGSISHPPCAASIHLNTTQVKTQREAGTCGVLSVRSRLQAHSGGHTFLTPWVNSSPGASSVTYNRPQQTSIRESHHNVLNYTLSTHRILSS